jgi:hypothetical protein
MKTEAVKLQQITQAVADLLREAYDRCPAFKAVIDRRLVERETKGQAA